MTPLRVAIDCRKLRDSGIGGYIEGLLRGLSTRDGGHDFVLFARPGDEPDLGRLLPSARLAPLAAPLYSARELVAPARAARRARADVYHAPHYTLPFGLPGARVVTVHDLIHLRVPDAVPRPRPLARVYARAVIGHAVRAATRVVTVSEHTRQDLLAAWPGAASKIRVIPSAVPERFRATPAPGAVDALRAARGLGPEAILFVGGARPHKNLAAALALGARLAPRRPALRLVVTGSDGRGIALPAGLDRDRVVWLAGVGDDEMPLLYAAARVLFFPSLYEGFGLPPLEAMAVGTPAVVSSRTALPETVGSAALLVDPSDAEAAATACARVLDDRLLAADLARRGHARAALFTPERLARSTLAVYEEAAAARPARWRRSG